jgi:glyoxylase-like metal-dependent hydrolase (beta-lactamase superfamily II)
MRLKLAAVAALLLAFSGIASMQSRKALDIYSIDVEGGQSTLFVSPSGESLLIDAGSAGERDAGRIVETAKQAGLTQIDYMLVTHYDGDHVGGVKDVSDRIPEQFIANLDRTPAPPAGQAPAPPAQPGRVGGRGGRGPQLPPHSPAYFLKVSVRPDGGFTVTNSRNGFSKEYAAGPKR